VTHLEAAALMVDPDGTVIPEYGIIILRAIDPDANEQFRFRVLGDPDLAGMLGLIEVIKDAILHPANTGIS
jgi:hypothetical protein